MFGSSVELNVHTRNLSFALLPVQRFAFVCCVKRTGPENEGPPILMDGAGLVAFFLLLII